MPSSNSVVIDHPIDAVFELVCDPRTYPVWLVGAQEIHRVDDNWPEPGASFDHRIGLGPVRIPGSTTVRDHRPPHHFALAAGMGPLGEARVDFSLRTIDGGATEVTIAEAPTGGPARLAWLVSRPLLFGLLWGRTQASLHGLAELADERFAAGEARR